MLVLKNCANERVSRKNYRTWLLNSSMKDLDFVQWLMLRSYISSSGPFMAKLISTVSINL